MVFRAKSAYKISRTLSSLGEGFLEDVIFKWIPEEWEQVTQAECICVGKSTPGS